MKLVCRFLKLVNSYFNLFILKLIFNNKTFNNRTNVLFVNTGFLGDVIITSLIMENENLFDDSIGVFYLFRNDFKKLFDGYKGKGKLIFFNLKRYRFDFFYKIYILKRIRKLSLRYSINLTTARGLTNDSLTVFSGASEKYFINNKHFHPTDNFNSKILNLYSGGKFTEIVNEYEKHKSIIVWLKKNNNQNIRFFNLVAFNTEILLNTYYLELLRYNRSIIVAPLSREGNKNWDLENYSHLIKELSKENLIFLIGSSNQRLQLEKIKQGEQKIINTAGDFKLNEIPSLLKKASLFIGNDSGITHLAIKLNIPTIAIIGGGGFGRFFPIPFDNLNVKYLFHYMDCFNCDWFCKFKEKYCLSRVSVEDVLNAIKIYI
ncbi:MAG: hypothetical protein N2490_09500 [Ignavibacteria bacterium]|nr:hypothetical protein [Ignavibacteria bacterium]